MAKDIYTTLTGEHFAALVAKGIHAILFKVERDGKVDKSKNLLYGCPVGSITTSGETVDSEEFQDQIRGGAYKTKVAGAVDPGDITFKTYFNPELGKPDIEGAVNSLAVTPQFTLILARKKNNTTLEGFFAAGVNYAGGNDIQGDYGKTIGSSLKFAITGEPQYGYDAVGTVPMADYEKGKPTGTP